MEAAAEAPVGGDVEGDGDGEGAVQLQDLLADDRCSQLVLDMLSTSDMGAPRPPVANDAECEASELELRQR
jgi:hypothetical protein